jgi:CheY-like chemotaxis protein
VGKDRINKLIQVIKKIPLFDGLGPSQVQTVLGACMTRKAEEGEVLCAAGTTGEELFILLTGGVGVFTTDGTEVATINPVATIGEMSIATKQTRTSTVKATQTCNMLVIKRVALDMALKTDPDAQAKIYRNVVEILAQRMDRDSARRRDDMLEKAQLQQAIQQLQKRADMALGLLSRKTDISLEEARGLLESEAGAEDIERRVLVVDDEDHVRKMLTKVLGDYDVVAVGSGAEAMETVMDSKPDLVITDIRMPDMDGFTLLEKMREFHPDVPVLALSGYVKDEDIQEYDFDGFVAKPMDLEQFKSTVASALASA